MDIREVASFKREEREEFRRAFEQVDRQLPVLYRAFWSRWEESDGSTPAFLVYAGCGSLVLRVKRLRSGAYRAEGMTARGPVIYAAAARTITLALESAGLL